MLTLKIIYTDIYGGKETHIFAGERISHIETECSDHCTEFTEEGDFFKIGELIKSSSTQPFVISRVLLFDGNDVQTIHILPKSECFIMSNGKTVDAFSCYYK